MRFNATLPLDDLRADLCRRVNAERDRIIAAGYEFGSHTYQIDPASLQAMRDALERGDTPIRWRTLDNRMVALGSAGLERLRLGASSYAGAVRQCAMQKKDAVRASDNPDPRIVKTDWPAPDPTTF